MTARAVIRRGLRALGRGLIWLWILLTLIPFVFMLVTSVKSQDLANTIPPVWNFDPTLSNYHAVLTAGATSASQSFAPLLQHSAIVAVGATLLALAVGIPAAYALTLRGFRRRRALAKWILSTIMFPPVVAAVPVFILAGDLNLIDTYVALIVPYAAFNLPMVIWLLRGSFLQIPRELEQAALVDGATRLLALRKVLLPLIAPTIATAAIFSIVLCWNEFLFALTLTRDSVKTAPVGVNEFTGMFGTQWGYLTAASTVLVAPVVVLTMVLRRRFVSGLTFGAVK